MSDKYGTFIANNQLLWNLLVCSVRNGNWFLHWHQRTKEKLLLLFKFEYNLITHASILNHMRIVIVWMHVESHSQITTKCKGKCFEFRFQNENHLKLYRIKINFINIAVERSTLFVIRFASSGVTLIPLWSLATNFNYNFAIFGFRNIIHAQIHATFSKYSDELSFAFVIQFMLFVTVLKI